MVQSINTEMCIRQKGFKIAALHWSMAVFVCIFLFCSKLKKYIITFTVSFHGN